MKTIHYLMFDRDLATQRFFGNKFDAIRALDEKKNEMRGKVTVSVDTETKFSYYYGWAEAGGTWEIHTKGVE